MRKRLLLCLAFVLLLTSAAAPAQAKGGGVPAEGNSETVIYAVPLLPVIEVSVPSSLNPFFNPNQLEVEIHAEIIDSQVVSVPAHIENRSVVPLRVSVEVTGEVWSDSDMTLSTTSLKSSKSTMKKAFLYFEMLPTTDPDHVTWAGKYSSSKHILVRNGITKSMKNMLILGAADHEKRFGAFQLTGDCVKNPKSGWSAEDGVTVNIIFTFSPLPVSTTIP